MQKNKSLRIAAVLALAVLLTTSAVSGTFAKYVTSNSVSDTARVAKWGVEITADGNLFGSNYETGALATSVPSAKVSASELSVMGGSAEIVVAPGTKGNTLKFAVTGTPEVRANIKLEVTASDIFLKAGTYAAMRETVVNAQIFSTKVLTGLYTKSGSAYSKVDTLAVFSDSTTYYELYNQTTLSDDYYPVVYTNTNSSANAAKATDLALLLAKLLDSALTTGDDSDLSAHSVGYTGTKSVDPGTDIATALSLGNNEITWSWAFENSKDEADTILGNLISGAVDVVSVDTGTGAVTLLTVSGNIVSNASDTVGYLATSLAITVSATQVD